MKYMDVKSASEKWGITPRRVRILCNDGRIDGAVRNGWSWVIPIDTPKPGDGRALRRFKSLDIRLGSIDVDSLDELKKQTSLIAYFNSPYYDYLLSKTISFLFLLEGSEIESRDVLTVLKGELCYNLSLEDHLLIVNFASLLRDLGERKTKWDIGEEKRVYSLLVRGIERTDGSIKDGYILKNGEKISIKDSLETIMNQYDSSWSNLNSVVSALLLSGEVLRIKPYSKHLIFFCYLLLAGELFRGGYIAPSFPLSSINEAKAAFALIVTKGIYVDMTSFIERVLQNTYGEIKRNV